MELRRWNGAADVGRPLSFVYSSLNAPAIDQPFLKLVKLLIVYWWCATPGFDLCTDPKAILHYIEELLCIPITYVADTGIQISLTRSLFSEVTGLFILYCLSNISVFERKLWRTFILPTWTPGRMYIEHQRFSINEKILRFVSFYKKIH